MQKRITQQHIAWVLASLFWAASLVFVAAHNHTADDAFSPYVFVAGDESPDKSPDQSVTRFASSSQFLHPAQSQPQYSLSNVEGWLPSGVVASTPYFVPEPLAPPGSRGDNVQKALKFGWLQSNLLYRGRLLFDHLDPAKKLG